MEMGVENEINFLEKRMDGDAEKLKELRAKERNDKFAADLRSIYDSLVGQGFSDEQAFWILAQAVMNIFKTDGNG